MYPLRRQNAGRQEDQVINRNVHCHDKIPAMSLHHLRYQRNATSWGPNVLMHEPRGQLKFKTENCPFSCTCVEHTMSLPFPGNSLLSLSDCIFCVRPEPWVLSPEWRLYYCILRVRGNDDVREGMEWYHFPHDTPISLFFSSFWHSVK